MAVEQWTDVMLNELASTVAANGHQISELRENLKESVTELRESIAEVKDSVDGVRITAQALLQVAAQHQQRMDRFDEEMDLTKQRQAESDERFNTLLAEIRYLNQRNNSSDED
jgi:ABC-type transporter Mla subunit MlaD